MSNANEPIYPQPSLEAWTKAAAKLGGMLTGRALIAKFVIMPMWEKDPEYQTDQKDIQSSIEESFTKLPDDPEMVKEMSKDDEFMIHIAAWDMVQEGKITQENQHSDQQSNQQLFVAVFYISQIFL